ncbi:type II toxin-antitoxin system HipA family toxin [Trinickia violacea]|uniref:type II toxin-antitoxin system HipA family toxin n=1 Tax=Trinickia violacea TaxID=2571746 RepID=UPI0020C79650|nr:HipA domain-containing protein [Trinickia violacea]
MKTGEVSVPNTAATRFDELFLWMLEAPTLPRLVGTLRFVNNGVSLRYAQPWLEHGFPLSEDLPLVDMEYLPRDKGTAVGALDDAHPDQWGERVLQFIDRPSRLSLMEYLYFAGDERFGAMSVSTSATEYLPRRVGPLPGLQSAQLLSEIVAKINAKEAISDIERKLVTAGGSFGGAKPKALIEIGGEQWLIKFFNNEPIDVPLVEHATMTLCAKADITVAETQVIPLIGENAIAVWRFDRKGTARIHCISAGTALKAAAPDTQPDLSYPALAQLLRRLGPVTEDRNLREMAELFRRMVFNILVDNTDDHEKNHSLFVTPKAGEDVAERRVNRLSVTPAYDVVPTNSGQGRHEFGIGDDGREATLANAMSQCNLFGLSSAEAAAEVLRVIAVVDGWKQHFIACGVTQADIQELEQRIDGDDLFSQRRSFKVDE